LFTLMTRPASASLQGVGSQCALSAGEAYSQERKQGRGSLDRVRPDPIIVHPTQRMLLLMRR